MWFRMEYAYPMGEVAQKRICAASLTLPAQHKGIIVMSSMSARQDSMCVIDMSGGCEIRKIPERGYDEACFYSVHKGMPREEEIATVLLQLANNPALFDKWAVQNGLAFKADGQVFTRAQ